MHFHANVNGFYVLPSAQSNAPLNCLMASKDGWGGSAKASPAKKKKWKGEAAAQEKGPPPLDTEGLNLQLKLVHAHGVDRTVIRNNAELVTIADESGVGREHVIYPTGQGLGLLRVDDLRMAFVGGSNSRTWKPGATKQILAMQLSPNRKHVAICERVTEPNDVAIVTGPNAHSPSNRQGVVGDADRPSVQYFVSVHRNISSSLNHPKITLTYTPPPPGKYAPAGPSFIGGVRFSKLAWSGDSKLLAACADGERDDEAAHLSLVVWEWSKDKVVASTHGPQDPKARIDATRLSFCPTDKSCLATSGTSSLKQWSVVATGNSVEARSLLPPNKSTDRFVDHAWMCGKAQPHEAPDRRLVVVTDGRTAMPSGSIGSDSGGGGGGVGGRGGGGEGRPSLARKASFVSRDGGGGGGGGGPCGFQVLVFGFSAEHRDVLELKHSLYAPLPAPLLGPLGGPACAVETIAAYGKGFVVAGSGGFFSVWDRTEPPAAFPYAPVKTVPQPLPPGDGSVGRRGSASTVGSGGSRRGGGGGPGGGLGLSWGGPAATITSVVVHPSDELLVAVTADRELLSFPLGNVDVMTDEGGGGGGAASPKAASGGARPFGDPAVDGGLGAFTRLGATHAKGVTCMATCLTRPLLATGGKDETVRVWDYSKWRGGGEAVLSGGAIGDGEPACLSLHPAGTSLVVGFERRVRLLSVLAAELLPLREVPISHATAVCFSHGGHLFAVGAGSSVTLHDALSGTELQSYQGHAGTVTSVSFGASDLELFSSGTDGTVCGWDLTTGKPIDEVGYLSCPVPCATAVVVATPPSAFGPSPASGGRRGGAGARPRTAPGSPKLNGREPTALERAAERRAAATATAVVASADGSLREVQWILGGEKADLGAAANKPAGGGGGGGGGKDEKQAGKKALPSSFRSSAAVLDREHASSGHEAAAYAAAVHGKSLLTCLAKVPGKPYLVAGSSNGNVHVYAWPLRFPKAPAKAAARKARGHDEGDDDELLLVPDKGGPAKGAEAEEEEEAAAAAAAAAAVEESPSLPAHVEVLAHGCAMTALCVTADDKLLFTGGADGSVSVFRLDELDDLDGDGLLNPASVASLATKSLSSGRGGGGAATSSGDEGFEGAEAEETLALSGAGPRGSLAPDAAGAALASGTLAELQAYITSELFATEVVQVSVTALEERAAAAADQRRTIEALKSENAFQLHCKDAEWSHRLKSAEEANSAALQAEVERAASLAAEKCAAEATFKESSARRDGLHTANTRELESQYEQKLGLEMRRYDKLSEEIELVQQRCEDLLRAQDAEHEAKLAEHDATSRRHEKELQLQVEHLTEDERHNRATFKEVLEQQEHEYEAELMALMAAAQEELTHERSNTQAMRVVAQERQRAIDGLRRRMDELKAETHRQDSALLAHKARNAKMEATLEHFRRHMTERESTLEDKEKSILELRRTNQTLDNFRFILDHRVGQLMDERGPLTKHIGDLEVQIDKVYDELETEFAAKKANDTLMEHKQMKVTTLTAELKVLRQTLREKETYIGSFKKTLSGLVSLTTAKDVEDAVKEAYQRFVKEEQPRKNTVASASARQLRAGTRAEDGPDELDYEFEAGLKAKGALGGGGGGGGGGKKEKRAGRPPPQPSADVLEMQEALSEAYRQRDCVEKYKDELKLKLERTREDAAKGAAKKLEENSQLMAECNELRRENVLLKRKVDHLRQLARDFEVDDRKRREGAKEAAGGAGFSDGGGGGGGTRRAAGLGVGTRRPATAGGSSRGGAGVGPTESVESSATNPFAPLMRVTRAFDGTGQPGGPATGADGRGASAAAGGGGGSGGGVSGGGVAAARAGRAAVAATNVELSQQLDENQRIIAMQRLEIAQLRQEIGLPFATAGGSSSAAAAMAAPAARPREVVRLRAKNPAAATAGKGEVGLFPTASSTGPFSSKPAVLERR